MNTQHGTMREIQQEVKAMNELIDLRYVLQHYKRLNQLLRGTNDRAERATIFLEFILSLNE